MLEHTPKVFKDNLVNRAAQILACYRKHCASPTSAGQLILPECLKLLPLYVSCLLKNDAFSGGSDLTVDDRSYAMYFVSTMDLPTSVTFFYPRLIPIHSVDPDGTEMPSPIRCTIDKMTDDGAYILGEEFSINFVPIPTNKTQFQITEFTCSSILALDCQLNSHSRCSVFKQRNRSTRRDSRCQCLTTRYRREFAVLSIAFNQSALVA